MLAVEILAFPYSCRRLSLCVQGSASDVDLLLGRTNLHMEGVYDLDGVGIDSHGNLILVGHCGLMGGRSLHQEGGRCRQTCDDTSLALHVFRTHEY